MINLETSINQKEKTTMYAQRALTATKYITALLQPEIHQSFNVIHKLTQIIEFMTLPQESKYVHLLSNLNSPLRIKGDGILLQEAICCLVTNGFEAYQDTSAKMVVISIWQEKNTLHLSVTDFGSGMTWLTKLFSTTKGFSIKERSSGYGLWFAERIIEDKFKGKIMIGSQSEVGTSIKIEIPLVS